MRVKAVVIIAMGAAMVAACPVRADPVGENACGFATVGINQPDPVDKCQFTADDTTHVFFTEFDSLRAYVDNDGNGRFDAAIDTDVLAAYSGTNHRVDPGPFFDRTEAFTGTYDVATGTVITVEALANTNYNGGYFIK
jgi:hypothetical protein